MSPLDQGVPVLADNAPCCNCPGRMRECTVPEGANSEGCYRNAQGLHKDYASFRILYEEHCLQRKGVDPKGWTSGPCPDDVPMLTTTGGNLTWAGKCIFVAKSRKSAKCKNFFIFYFLNREMSKILTIFRKYI